MVVCLRYCLLFCLGLTLSPAGRTQTAVPATQNGGTKPDALTFLNQIFDQYAHASSYHIESVEETQLNGEFSRLWTKSFTTSIVGANNRYRFETSGDQGTGIQISDGKTEWIYYPPFHQYIQQAAPGTGPSRVQSRTALGLSSLMGAQRASRFFSNLPKFIRTGAYSGDATIDVNGKRITCTVIRTEGELPGISAHITTEFTFWIDNATKEIRKMTERREGPLHPPDPDANYVMDRQTLFLVMELNVKQVPDRIFTFDPPTAASLVKEFEDPVSGGMRQFVGKQAPAITLRTAEGKEVSLQSFQGKPVLLDFWATWCAPCVESLPAIEKLYRETAKTGLVLLSIDEDEDAKKASDFWSMHKEPWPNFHGSMETLGQFPEHGIPYFVLIDASGQVVFSGAGLEEKKLRIAVESLGHTAPGSKANMP
jgi:thiol-disulfide isomerase/thioredoxin